MRTVAMISQKGGAGKTTLAVALAALAERAGIASVLVDLDPQASAARWGDLRENDTPVVTCAPAARLVPVLAAARAARRGCRPGSHTSGVAGASAAGGRMGARAFPGSGRRVCPGAAGAAAG